MYDCKICKKRFLSSSILKSHKLRFHTKIKQCKSICKICKETFKNSEALKTHSLIHTVPPENEDTYECNTCNKLFKSRKDIKEHVKSHSRENEVSELKPEKSGIKMKLIENQEAFAANCFLKLHSRKHTEEVVYKCDYCDKVLDTLSAFDIHVSQCTEEPVYTCYLCHASFKSNSSLQNHSETHRKVVRSSNRTENHCSVLTRNRCNVRTPNPYRCHTCQKTFRTSTWFEFHICYTSSTTKSKDSNERPFKCTHCDKTFSLLDSLLIHLRTHTGERPYKCKYCGGAFPQLNSCKVHERLHTGEKPFACTVCDKMFKQRSHLQKHINSHFRNLSYECDQCDMCFETELSLVCHMNKAHNESDEMFICEECGEIFPYQLLLDSHKLIHSMVASGESPSVIGKRTLVPGSEVSLLSH